MVYARGRVVYAEGRDGVRNVRRDDGSGAVEMFAEAWVPPGAKF